MLFGKKQSDKYVWTNHSRMKTRYYRLTESRIKRIIRNPSRVEEGILEGAVACMQPADGKNYSEIWVMYLMVGGGGSLGDSSRRHAKISQREIFAPRSASLAPPKEGRRAREAPRGSSQRIASTTPDFSGIVGKQIKIITAWRYPGKSPERDPVPAEVLREIRKLI